MTSVKRVLDHEPVTSLSQWVAGEGRTGYEAALRLSPEEVVEVVLASGLRGRGGAGFPTGIKWRSVVGRSPSEQPTVVVNAAEGEPGSYKDRAIINANPYRVLEGALIAAHAVGGSEIIVGVKETFTDQIARLEEAAREMCDADWTAGIDIRVVAGSPAYLLGEETGLLEVIAGRPPFPRIAPPYRDGSVDSTTSPDQAARTLMANDQADTYASVTLVNNVETLANVPFIFSEGVDAFRSVGTEESPGTVVCTISGDTKRHGVVEVAMGTPLSEVIQAAGGGPRKDRKFVAALSGVANPFLPAEAFDTPLSHEAMRAAGSGLGAAGFIIFDDSADLVAVAAGASRFLAVESCGQCEHCKYDGVAIANALDALLAGMDVRVAIDDKLSTVANGARCTLASQQQSVVGSLMENFEDHVWTHAEGGALHRGRRLIAPIERLEDHQFVLYERQADKQPDWTFNPRWDGASPSDMIDVAGGGQVPQDR